MIADDIGIFLIMGKKLLVVFLAMDRDEAGGIERITGPVQGRGLAKHWAFAAVHHAFDEFELGVKVFGFGILVHVEPSETPGPLHILRVRRHGETHPVEKLQPFTVVHPIELRDELLVIHPLPGDRHIGGFRFGVLLEVAFPTVQVHGQQIVVAPKGMQFRPAIEVLGSIVRAIVAPQRTTHSK